MWAQSGHNNLCPIAPSQNVPNLCCLAEEVAKRPREKNCSRPLQSNGRGGKADDLCRVWAEVASENKIKTMGTLRTQ
jgi:hypothetical protein